MKVLILTGVFLLNVWACGCVGSQSTYINQGEKHFDKEDGKNADVMEDIASSLKKKFEEIENETAKFIEFNARLQHEQAVVSSEHIFQLRKNIQLTDIENSSIGIKVIKSANQRVEQ